MRITKETQRLCVSVVASLVCDGQYAFPEDRAIARIADPQGLGGALGVPPAPESPTAEGEGRDT